MATIAWNNTYNAYQVTIPAGQAASKQIVLKAKDQSTLTDEAMLEQVAGIIVWHNPRNYNVVTTSTTSAKNAERKIYSGLKLSVLKNITRFGTAGNSPISHFESAISMADVKQGGHGDCYFMTALLPLVAHQSGRTHIVEHTAQNQLASGAKEFEVEFEDKSTNQPANSKYTFSTSDSDFLDRGYQMAQLGGDWHKDSDVTPNANIHRNNDPDIDDGAEIWTQLYESAWAKYKGGWKNSVGGDVSHVWKIITGKNATVESLAGMSKEQIFERIKQRIKDGKWLCALTKKNVDQTIENFYSGNFVGNHTYYVKELLEKSTVSLSTLELKNPWGQESDVNLSYEHFESIDGLVILDPLP
jgi:hypothetical protein